jgi:hypothetical protein
MLPQTLKPEQQRRGGTTLLTEETTKMAKQRSDDSPGLTGFLLGLLGGFLVGSVLGVLYAPHRGDITRRKIRRRAEDLKDQMGEAADSAAE